MCELCDRDDFEVEPLEGDEEIWCEWFDEAAQKADEAFSCGASAAYVVTQTFVEDHLCSEHARMEGEELEDGLEDFLESAGLGSAELAPVQTDLACEYQDLVSPKRELCLKRAEFAKVITDESFLCEEHARRDGYLSK